MARNGQRATGLPANDSTTFGPNLSTNGQYVVFGSQAANLVPGDTNGVADVFVNDRGTGVTERVSVSSAGVQGNQPLNYEPTVSDDGDVIAFASFSSNLDPNCPGTIGQVFVRTRSAGTTECISIDAGGAEGNGTSGVPNISANGRYVVFDSEASNLVAGDTNATQDIFVRDLVTDTTERVNLKRNGSQSAGSAFWPDISDDGHYVAYRTAVGDLDPDCPAGTSQVYVTDRINATNDCVSVDSGGQPGNDYSDQPRLSGDGRYVAFFARASNLDPACPTTGPAQAYLHDRDTGTTTCESVDGTGAQGDEDSFFPELSGDGRTMSFLSSATNLDPHCPNTIAGVRPQMFIRDLDTHVNTCVSVDATGQAAGNALNSGSLSADGRLVAFESSGALAPGDTNGLGDMFVRDTITGVTTIVSAVSVQPDADVIGPDLSDDGRYLAFATSATNLVPNDAGGARDIFRRDQLTGDVKRVSVTTLIGIDFAANAGSRNPSISGNGNVVAFVSDATNLVTGDTNGVADVFVREIGSRTTTRVSVGGGGAQPNGAGSEPAISGNGRYVAFESAATNLDPNSRRRAARASTCVTARPERPPASRRSSVGSVPRSPERALDLGRRPLRRAAIYSRRSGAVRCARLDRRVGPHARHLRLRGAGEPAGSERFGYAGGVQLERPDARGSVHERRRPDLRRERSRPTRSRARASAAPAPPATGHPGAFDHRRRPVRGVPHRGDQPRVPGRRHQRPGRHRGARHDPRLDELCEPGCVRRRRQRRFGTHRPSPPTARWFAPVRRERSRRRRHARAHRRVRSRRAAHSGSTRRRSSSCRAAQRSR